MSDEISEQSNSADGGISISKKTLKFFVALLLATALGAYVVFGFLQIPAPNEVSVKGAGQPSSLAGPGDGSAEVQDVYLTVTASGYDKDEITVKKGVPVRLHFTAINAGCGSTLVISGLGVRATSRNGQESVVEFTPTEEKTYQYSCPMRMFGPGKFIVTS